jgi:hypothetical protein
MAYLLHILYLSRKRLERLGEMTFQNSKALDLRILSCIEKNFQGEVKNKDILSKSYGTRYGIKTTFKVLIPEH